MLFEVQRDGMNAWQREFWVSSSATCSGGHGGAAVAPVEAPTGWMPTTSIHTQLATRQLASTVNWPEPTA